MAYYHILKRRRLDLNLSVQDISIQTHLAPEYIRAIEENNLDVFSDDFSFVRYFVRAYCDAIGVNWQAVQPEVEATIAAYAHARDQALTEAQKRMAQSMPATTKKKKRKGKRRKIRSHPLQNSAALLSRKLNWQNRDQLSKGIIITVVCVLAGLIALNYVVDAISARSIANAKAEKQAELAEKEKETQMLASQYASQKKPAETTEEQPETPAIEVSAEGDDVNHFTVSNAVGSVSSLALEFTLVEDTSIQVWVDDAEVGSTLSSEAWSLDVPVEQDCTITIYFSNYTDGDYLHVSHVTVPIDGSGFNYGEGYVVLHVTGSNASAEDTEAQEAEMEQADEQYEQEQPVDDQGEYQYDEQEENDYGYEYPAEWDESAE